MTQAAESVKKRRPQQAYGGKQVLLLSSSLSSPLTLSPHRSSLVVSLFTFIFTLCALPALFFNITKMLLASRIMI